MKSNLFIKYDTKDIENSDGLDLTTLGEAFIGIDSNLRELFELSGIDGKLTIKTEKISEGSIIAQQAIQVVTTVPFSGVKELLDFLYVVGAVEYKTAADFFQAIGNGYKTVNDFMKENPLVLESIGIYLSYYFGKMMDAAGSQKNGPRSDQGVGNLPMKYAKGLYRMIIEGKFKKTLKPIVDGGVREIAISNDPEFKDGSKINTSNFENYLPEEEKILSELENGMHLNFKGELRAIQSTKGEILKLKIFDIDERFDLLTGHPPEGKNTEDFVQFYKKNVNIEAEIVRDSMYRKPELNIINISSMQQAIFDGETPKYEI